MRAPVVQSAGLNQRFEFRSMDAGTDVLQNAARLVNACTVRTWPPTSPPLGAANPGGGSFFIASSDTIKQDKVKIQVRCVLAAL
jgi:hypothetical protein